MALSRLLLLLVAVTAITGTSEGQANFYATKCYPPPPTPTADGGSAFRGSLLNLLGALPSAAAPTGFASLQTAGSAVSDRALVRGFCFGESAPEPCRSCLSDAGKKITLQCGDARRRAGFWAERCFLGYADGSNTSSSAGADDMGAVVYFSGEGVPSPDIAGVRILVALAQSLAPRAATGSVATAGTNTPASKGDATVRVLAQCARDQAAADCVGCLRGASLSMAKSWGSSDVVGSVAAVLGSNCYLRFETSTPPLPLGEKIWRFMKDNLILTVDVALLIILIVCVRVLYLCDQRTVKATNNSKAAAAAAAAAVQAKSGTKTRK